MGEMKHDPDEEFYESEANLRRSVLYALVIVAPFWLILYLIWRWF